ncbi:MAG: Gx transporter family protein [Ruminococcaceae bacterium]|nr:Gx transporter family protein [Oscillospiraceae bacterium]
MKNTKRMTFLGLAAAVCLVLSFVETLLPPLIAAVPGIKLGLPNIMIIFVLYRFSVSEAAIVSLVRLLAVALLFGSAMTFMYSLAGAVLSLAVMAILRRLNVFSKVGVSVAGGVCHNVGQILVAIAVLATREIGYYFPVLAVSGIVTGAFVGLCAAELSKRTEKIKF